MKFFTSFDLNEFTRFVLVGLVNTGIGYLVFFICVSQYSIHPAIGNAIGYLVAVAFAYFLYRYLVFKGTQETDHNIGFYVIAFLIAFGSNLLVLYALVELISFNPYIAQIFAMATYTLMFYFLNKRFTFNTP